MECCQFNSISFICRGYGDICSTLSSYLAPRRNGRTDSCFSTNPRCYDGNGGCLPCVPYVTTYGICAQRNVLYNVHRCYYSFFCRYYRSGTERYQKSYCIFDLLTTWIYVCCRWFWGIFRGNVSFIHTCLF